MSIEKLQDIHDELQLKNLGYMHRIAVNDLRKVIKDLKKVESTYSDICKISEIFCDSIIKINKECTFNYDTQGDSKIIHTFSYPVKDVKHNINIFVQIEYCNKGYTICCHPYDRTNMISFWLPYRAITNKRIIGNIAVYALNLGSSADAKLSSDLADKKLCSRIFELERIVHAAGSKFNCHSNGIGETDPNGFDMWLNTIDHKLSHRVIITTKMNIIGIKICYLKIHLNEDSNRKHIPYFVKARLMLNRGEYNQKYLENLLRMVGEIALKY